MSSPYATALTSGTAPPKQTVSIVGCGYTGLRLARRWQAAGHDVRGYATRTESLRQIAALGAQASPLNLDQAPAPIDVDGQLLYYAAPPAPVGDRDLRLERLLEQSVGTPRRFVYLSTTGVYGDRGGGAVDEASPAAPKSERAIRRLAAETSLRRWADSRAVSWCILRIPGIYGPTRLPLDRLRRREPAIDPAEASPGNRIQVEDLVTACVAAGVAPQADDRIYNITDGSDDSATAFLQRVARIANLPPPPLVSLAEARKTFGALAWSFLSESRRVDNRRMLDELQVALAFRDLDAGIRASL
jgi:nucleoside-diphosphate-sugar epimerase